LLHAHLSFKILYYLLIFFLSCSVITNTSAISQHTVPQPIFSSTIYVNWNNTQGPWDGSLEHPFQRIQDGINNAKDNDTVYVFSGLYYEHVRVNKTITLQGEDKNTTIIDANYSSTCVFLVSGNVHINGFTIQHSGTNDDNDAGVGILNLGHQSHGNIIEGNIMQYNYYGVFNWASDSNIISNNIIRNNNDGIYFQAYDTNTIIINNSIINNGNGIRIYEDNSYNNVLSSNIIDNNTVYGILMCGYNCTITSNHISRSKNGVTVLGYHTNIQRNNITQNNIGLEMVLTIQSSVKENSFINNLRDATFTYVIMQRVMLPFILYPQITKWHANYWDKYLIGPKIIHGKMNPSIWFNIGIPWLNFDFSPAKNPYPDNTGGG